MPLCCCHCDKINVRVGFFLTKRRRWGFVGSSLGLGPSTGFGFRFEVRVLTQEATHKLAGYFIFVHHVCVYARDSHCKFQLPFPPFQTDMPRTLSEGRRGSNKKKKKKQGFHVYMSWSRAHRICPACGLFPPRNFPRRHAVCRLHTARIRNA